MQGKKGMGKRSKEAGHEWQGSRKTFDGEAEAATPADTDSVPADVVDEGAAHSSADPNSVISVPLTSAAETVERKRKRCKHEEQAAAFEAPAAAAPAATCQSGTQVSLAKAIKRLLQGSKRGRMKRAKLERRLVAALDLPSERVRLKVDKRVCNGALVSTDGEWVSLPCSVR